MQDKEFNYSRLVIGLALLVAFLFTFDSFSKPFGPRRAEKRALWAMKSNDVGFLNDGGTCDASECDVDAGDTENPDIELTNFLTQQETRTNTTPFDIEGTAADESGIDHVEWDYNASSSNCTGTTTWSCNITPVAGLHTVTIKAYDNAGNSSQTFVDIYGSINAWRFNGSDEYINLGSTIHALLLEGGSGDLLTKYTIISWVNTDSLAIAFQPIISLEVSDSEMLSFGIEELAGDFLEFKVNEGQTISDLNQLVADDWMLLAVVVDLSASAGQEIKFYKKTPADTDIVDITDLVVMLETTFDNGAGDGYLFHADPSGGNFDGKAAQFIIYRGVAFTPAEIENVYLGTGASARPKHPLWLPNVVSMMSCFLFGNQSGDNVASQLTDCNGGANATPVNSPTTTIW